ncbi:MAG: SDR family oxidoreductase [Rhizobiaceae bacterium]
MAGSDTLAYRKNPVWKENDDEHRKYSHHCIRGFFQITRQFGQYHNDARADHRFIDGPHATENNHYEEIDGHPDREALDGYAAHQIGVKGSGDARYCQLDVTSPHDWAQVVADCKKREGYLTNLVNNAGIVNRTGIVETPPESWQRVLDVNITGTFLGMQAAAPLSGDSGGGAIVNISSMAAFTAHIDPAYAASKAAILGLTRTAALEFVDRKIRVNAVCPGVMATDINAGNPKRESWRLATPLGRYGKLEETANAVKFLLGKDASFITGTELAVDGGIIFGWVTRLIALREND